MENHRFSFLCFPWDFLHSSDLLTLQAHVLNLLKAKLIDYRDFDTLLYTCAKEFDFLGWEMPYKTTVTLLLPSAILVIILVLYQWIKRLLCR